MPNMHADNSFSIGKTPLVKIRRLTQGFTGTVLGKVEGRNPDTDQDEQALLQVLGSHHRKEERALYPAIDNVTSAGERETVFQNMKTIPEDRYNASCGQD